MRKNVLVSILAMTSASTLTAWADANLDQIKTDAATDWEGASDLTIESGMIVSPSGLTITQNIGKLYPGKYTLTAGTNENAKIKVNGAALDAENSFTLTEEKDVIISIESANGGQYKVGGLKLTLKYSFSDAKNQLTTKLSEFTNKIFTGDAAGQLLLQESSEIASKIAVLSDDINSYDKYVEYELYKGLENSKLYAEIETFGAKVDAQANNSSAYDAAEKAGNNQADALKALKATVDGITDKTENTYVSNITKSQYDAANNAITNFLTNAKASYDKGTAGIDYTDAVISKFTEDAGKLVAAYGQAITDAKADHAAYVDMSAKLTTIKNLYNTSLQEVYNSLQGDDTHPDVYGNLRTEAQEKLNAVYMNIMTVEKANGTAEDHSQAADTQAENEGKLTTYTAEINQLKSDYTTLATNLKTAYTNAVAEQAKLQNSLDALKKTPGVGDNDKFTADINKIQASIDAFGETIKTDNEANKIYGKDYTETINSVNKAIDQLISNSQGAVDNYKAWQAVTTLLEGKQTDFNAAKEAVGKLKSTDEKYTASGKYPKVEADIQKYITDFKSGADAALAAGTCVTYQTNNQKAITDLSDSISTYKSNAEAAINAYNTIVSELAKYNPAIAKLVEKVTNRNVTVGSSTTTYGDKIDAFQAKVTEITKAKDNALALTDKKHYEAMVAAANLTNGVTIVDEANALVSTYDADKANYDKNVVDQALANLLNQATSLVGGAQSKLDAYSWTSAELGLSYDNIIAEKTVIENKLDAQREQISEAQRQTDKTAAMAVLTKVNTAVSAIHTEIDALIEKANGVKAKVTANNEAKTNAYKVIDAINEQLNGKADGTLKSVAALNEDVNRTTEFANLVSSLQSKIDAQKAAVDAAHSSETLVAAWADSQDAKGIESKLNEISQEVANARSAAEASTVNYKAYNEILAKITELAIETNLTKASADVAAVEGISAEAKAYYDGVIKGYSDNLAALRKQAGDAYSGEKRNCADVKETIINQLTNLNNNIKVVGQNATNNQTAYNGQATDYEKKNQYWADTYYAISTGDQTSEVQGYLNELTVQQTKLTELNAAIKSFYETGLSAAKNDSILNELTNVNNAIQDIAARQHDGYDIAVAKDNLTRYTAFTTTVSNVRKSYDEALETISKFSALTNSALVETANSAITTANTAINGILTNLRALESKVEEEYNSTVSPALFDATEAHKAEAEAFITEINDAITALDNAVSGVAKSVFGTEFTDAENKLNAAIDELEAAGYNENVVKNAFADVRTIVADANKDFEDKFFALSVDAHLNAFETIDSKLVAGKEEAAKNEWNVVITAINNQVAQEKADLQKFEYTGDLDGSQKATIIKNYDELVKNTVTAAITAYNKIEAGKYYVSLPGIKDLLKPFESSTIYTDAKTASQNQAANKEAYEAMKKEMGTLQATLDAAVAFVNNYVITNDCGRSTAQNMINNLLTTIEGKLQNGGCVNYYNDGEGEFKTAYVGIEASIKTIYDNANGIESDKLATEIESLKGDQNKAANAVDTDAEKAAEVAAYITKIEDLAKSLTTTLNSDDYLALDAKSKQPVLLGFETKIANMRAELAAYYDNALVATTAEALNKALAEVETNYNAEVEVLNGCHKNVIADYTEALAAVKASIDGIRADINKYNDADGSILFYEGKIKTNITSVANELKELTADIAKAQEPYTINDNKYVELTNELNELSESMTALEEKLGNFVYFDTTTESYKNEVKAIRDLIAADQKTADDANATSSLKANSTNANKAVISARIAALDKLATYTEMDGRINSVSTNAPGLKGKWNGVNSLIQNSKYTDEVRADLQARLNSIYTLWSYLSTYNADARYGTIYYDLDGKPVYADNDVQGVAIDYMTEAVPAAETRLAELLEQLSTLETAAKDNAYILGDVNRDKAVLVDDYTQILNYVLEIETVEEGTMEFLAADANEDGKVNIGDVTRTTNIILGNTSGFSMHRAAALATARQTEAGHIELATEQDGNITRIAVKIAGMTQVGAGCQMDIKLPSSVTLLSETAVSSEHTLKSNTLADGTHRVVISSLQNSELGANGEAVLVLELTGRGAENIAIGNVLAADAAGVAYSIEGTGNITGINGVDTDKNFKQKIYSVGGQMLKSLQKGVNILRGSDGSTKKVFGK